MRPSFQTGASTAAILDSFVRLIFATHFSTPLLHSPSGISAIVDYLCTRGTMRTWKPPRRLPPLPLLWSFSLHTSCIGLLSSSGSLYFCFLRKDSIISLCVAQSFPSATYWPWCCLKSEAGSDCSWVLQHVSVLCTPRCVLAGSTCLLAHLGKYIHCFVEPYRNVLSKLFFLVP